MITKNDLVKKFELVVKQEIVNHNRSISETNLSINSLKNKIESLEKLIKVLNNSQEQKLSTYAVESEKVFHKFFVTMELLEKKYQEFSKNTIKRIEQNEKSDKEQIKDILYILNNNAISILEIKNMQKELEKSNKKSINEIEYLVANKIEEISVIFYEINSEIEHLKIQRCEFEKEIKNYVKERLADVRGNKQEIEKLKKKQFIQEKTCEYFTTQLDRLKENK